MRQKSWYTKKLAALLVKEEDPDELGLMVISSIYGGWSVVRDNRKRAIRVFDLQKDAVAFAKKYAISKSAKSLSIHDENGSVKKLIYFKKA